MADRYQQLVNTPIGKLVTKQIGLPAPQPLERYEPGRPVIDGAVLFGAASGSTLAAPIAGVLASIDADVETFPGQVARQGAADAGLAAGLFNPDTASADDKYKALVFDASGIAGSEDLREAWEFFHPTLRRVRRSGRVIVLGLPPESCEDPERWVAQRALEGLTRSLGKEVRGGATAQLVYVHPGAEDQLDSTLRFFLSPKSAYVSGQVVRVGAAVAEAEQVDWDQPLNGKVALVTGASRGIGRAIADVLARDGAHVVGVDVPAQESELAETIGRLGGSTLTVDITDDGAPATIAANLLDKHGGVDIVVHNAGVTRDKTIARMDEQQWTKLLAINLVAPHLIDRELFARDVVRPNGRIVCVSSISGIAGNAGQTNYATSKAGVIGLVEAYARPLAERGATINAVAPGFIETQMTAAMPIATREAGRRMNSLSQGGLPIDVAETIAWFANPGSAGVTGQVVRVCGQSLLGA
jgi:3-oxoacyl-[acyl-carrier protein] reductase